MGTGKKLEGAGLRGQIACQTALCTVGKSEAGLTYRGYDINTLDNARFEEVAYLLLYGKLPNQKELDACLQRLRDFRSLPAPLKTVLEQLPIEFHIPWMCCGPVHQCLAIWKLKQTSASCIVTVSV